MVGAPLHVEQPHSRFPHQVDQRHQSHFRRVTLRREHRFTGEEALNLQSVQTTGQPALPVEDFDAVRPTELVQPRVRLDERGRDPPMLPGRIGAAAHDVDKRGIDTDLKAARALAHRSRHTEIVEGQNATRVRRPPRQHGIRKSRLHWKESLAVGRDDRAGSEIAASRNEIVCRPELGTLERPSAGLDRVGLRVPIGHRTPNVARVILSEPDSTSGA